MDGTVVKLDDNNVINAFIEKKDLERIKEEEVSFLSLEGEKEKEGKGEKRKRGAFP